MRDSGARGASASLLFLRAVTYTRHEEGLDLAGVVLLLRSQLLFTEAPAAPLSHSDDVSFRLELGHEAGWQRFERVQNNLGDTEIAEVLRPEV